MTTVTLEDRFTRRDGRILITGVQALVRLMLIQAERDRGAGLKTGGFVSGYRGSPLGTLDFAFASAKELISERGIEVQPAVNEEMAATAIAGTQQIERSPGARVQGIFSLWYGKGPGVDRAADAIRHGNYQGTSPYGGVVMAVGDDHIAKSSTVVCYSDETVASVQVPLFYPADANEIVRFGLHCFALSRQSGCWTALKIITEVADATRAVSADELDEPILLPEIDVAPMGMHNKWPEMPLDQELRHKNYRLPAVQAYVRANRLDHIAHKQPGARIGIISAGKSWLDVVEALRLLMLDEAQLTKLGIALYKPAMIWPLEPEGLKEFSEGLDALIVVEEKSPLIETQVKSILYGTARAPLVFGKVDANGADLFPSIADLNPERIAAKLASFIAAANKDADMVASIARIGGLISDQQALAVPPAIRKPYFCSGCPHNRSTVVPEGSRAMAGIGCHGFAAGMRPRTGAVSQMGGEGIHWMGMAPFTDEAHMFANLGDGTYFHSGLLAIRQAVAARLNITYKLLYNSAVAMTGGQPVDGELSVLQMVEQLRAEGVGRIVVSTDDPERYPANDPVRAKVYRVEHRDDLDALQLEMRDYKGVSVILYEQMCASEKRRLRKRGKMVDPSRRLFINELVCEGCGDCSTKSNCLSVEPVQTELGTKRRINQSSCNKDFSCALGFCPSFVTIEGGKPRKAKGVGDPAVLPALITSDSEMPVHQRVLVAGVGGTGIVTVGALLSMAGHMEGHNVAVLDQVGLAQKGGAVASHIHVARDPIHALRIPAGEADLIIACDQIVANMKDVIAAVTPGSTRVLANADVSITGDFTQNREAVVDVSLLTRRLANRAGDGNFIAHPFTQLAERLLGDAIGSNLMMVGFAYQLGWLKFELAPFLSAIELNGVALKLNLNAFNWGRMLAVEPEQVYTAASLRDPIPEKMEDRIERYAAFLAEYQDNAYSLRFRGRIERVRAAESRVSQESNLTEAATDALYKLMAYKDEYEVARLYTDGRFQQALAEHFEGPVRLSFNMAPPILAKKDPVTGHLRKRSFGPWMMTALRVLARFRHLRGSRWDIFGYTEERRTERKLMAEYEALLDSLADQLTPGNLDAAIKIARLPMDVRGYGHVKDEAIVRYQKAIEEQVRMLHVDVPQMVEAG